MTTWADAFACAAVCMSSAAILIAKMYFDRKGRR
jgi:hypothetical protein